MNAEQKADIFNIFDGVKNNGNLDYVACWYKKSAEYMHNNPRIKTALVSTNSITQGEQVAILWKTLFDLGVEIDFAYRTFRWDSESNDKAKVHCVIIGFSLNNNNNAAPTVIASEQSERSNPPTTENGSNLSGSLNNSTAVGWAFLPTNNASPTVIASEQSERSNPPTTENGSNLSGSLNNNSTAVGWASLPTNRPDRGEENPMNTNNLSGSLKKQKIIYNGNQQIIAKNINGYLLDAPNIFVESRSKPICAVSEIGMGNQPIDDGNYLFTETEKDEFIKIEPNSAKYFKQWIGSREFINREYRYVLLLRNCPISELRTMHHCMDRVEKVKQFRLKSKSKPTRLLAETPLEFNHSNFPQKTYIVIPEVSSERRRYIPMGFMTPDIICSNLVKIIPHADLYMFGVLTSSVHMAWMRAVAGRLEMRYRYSGNIVYNNFIWCEPSEQQRQKIEQTAQAILNARNNYPDSSLADMYGDKLYLYADLRAAHTANDQAVLAAYGLPKNTSEEEIVAFLMQEYQKRTGA